MKLLRYGAPGAEKPGLLDDDGNIRDLSGHVDDIGGDTLSDAGLESDIADFTTTIDIDWENIFTTQITKLLSVNLYTRWVYDKYDNSVMPVLADDGSLADPGVVRAAVRKSGQFKQTLGIGITYRFL